MAERHKAMLIKQDGKYYKADDKGVALKDSEGNLIPASEQEVKEFEEKNKPQPVDPSKATLDDLAKVNPDVAKLLADQREADRLAEERRVADEEAERKRLEEQGKWQDIAKTAEAKAKEAEAKAAKATAALSSYQTTIQQVLQPLEAKITDDKKSLIPETLTDRQRFEYIMKNAAFLGISGATPNIGSEVPKNQDTPPADEEGKLREEFDGLMKKGNTRTPSETSRMVELGNKLKEIQRQKAAK